MAGEAAPSVRPSGEPVCLLSAPLEIALRAAIPLLRDRDHTSSTATTLLERVRLSLGDGDELDEASCGGAEGLQLVLATMWRHMPLPPHRAVTEQLFELLRAIPPEAVALRRALCEALPRGFVHLRARIGVPVLAPALLLTIAAVDPVPALTGRVRS